MFAPSEAVWVPVEVSGPLPAGEAQQVVLQTALDAVPGLWPNGAREGMLLVANLEEVDEPLECGTVVGEVVQGPTVTQVCGACAGVDTWLSRVESDMLTVWTVRARSPEASLRHVRG